MNEVCLHDCNWTQTHNHLVHKRKLNHCFAVIVSNVCIMLLLSRNWISRFYRVNLCSSLLATVNIQHHITSMALFSVRTAEILFWLCSFPAFPAQNLVLVLNLFIFNSSQRFNYYDWCHTDKFVSTDLLTRFWKSLNFCFPLAYQTF